ncbi:unnamed protein product [Amoebophrya sp. A120]|nr:unnamed protein product [Amoebophrya sp. A120]|eukprot:GSA120T00005082001.1
MADSLNPPDESHNYDQEHETPLPSWNTLDFGAGMQELTILRAIEEYLTYHGFEKSLKTLKKEATSLNSNHAAASSQSYTPEALLEAFDSGDSVRFFRGWRRLEQASAAATNSVSHLSSLELRLRVYFAILPMRKRLQNNEKFPRQKQGEFEELKEYLAEHQDEDGSMVAFYALPFVPTPHQHPELKHIFAQKWVDDLRAETSKVLHEFPSSAQNAPRYPFLYALIEGPVAGSASSLYPVRDLLQISELALKHMGEALQQSNSSSDEHLGAGLLPQLADRYQYGGSSSSTSANPTRNGQPGTQLPASSSAGGGGGAKQWEAYEDLKRKLNGVVQQLYSRRGSMMLFEADSARANIKSRGALVSRGVHSRQSLYSRYGARPSRQSTLYSRSGSRSRTLGIMAAQANSGGASIEQIGPCARFDFQRIRTALQNPPPNSPATLQNDLFISILKHCCSAFDPLADRRAFLHGICCFDILHVGASASADTGAGPLTSTGDPASSAFASFLQLDACIALIAVIACEAGGRVYLSQNPSLLIRGLMQHLGRSDNTELQALVALQRLSLSQKMQEAMICDEQLMSWILGEFREFILFSSSASNSLNPTPMGSSSGKLLRSSSSNNANGATAPPPPGGTIRNSNANNSASSSSSLWHQQDRLSASHSSGSGGGAIAATGSLVITGQGNQPEQMSAPSQQEQHHLMSRAGAGLLPSADAVSHETFMQMAHIVHTDDPSRPSRGTLISEITLEFGSALLMNLALRKAGKNQLEKIPSTLPVLAALMLCPHIDSQVRTYANGTLYSLLGRPHFRQEAERIGFRSILEKKQKLHQTIQNQADSSCAGGVTSSGQQHQDNTSELGRQVDCLLEQFSKSADAAILEEEEEEIDEGDEECFLAEEELSAWVIPPNSKVSELLSEQFAIAPLSSSALSNSGTSSMAAGGSASKTRSSNNTNINNSSSLTAGSLLLAAGSSAGIGTNANSLEANNARVFAQFLENMHAHIRQTREAGQRNRGKISSHTSTSQSSSSSGVNNNNQAVSSVSMSSAANSGGATTSVTTQNRSLNTNGTATSSVASNPNAFAPIVPFSSAGGATSTALGLDVVDQHTSSRTAAGGGVDGASIQQSSSSLGGPPSVLTNVMNTSARNFDFNTSGNKNLLHGSANHGGGPSISNGGVLIQGSSLVANSAGLLVNSMQRNSGAHHGGASALPATGEHHHEHNYHHPSHLGASTSSSRGGFSTRGASSLRGGPNSSSVMNQSNNSNMRIMNSSSKMNTPADEPELTVSGEPPSYHNFQGPAVATDHAGGQKKKSSYGLFGGAGPGAKHQQDTGAGGKSATTKRKTGPTANSSTQPTKAKTENKPKPRGGFFGLGRQ